MGHEELQSQLAVHRDLKSRAEKVAVQKFHDDNLVEELAKKLGRDATEEEITARAVVEMAVLQCGDCQEPYCAGRIDCATAAQYDEAEVPVARCPDCEWSQLAVANDHRCMVHGHRFAMFKCDSCCSVATWNCFSNHYCERCHNQAGTAKHYPCPGPELCPLGMLHPPNQEAIHCSGNFASFCIGCTACFGCQEEQEELEFNENNVFGFPQRDWLQHSSGKQVLELIGEDEVRARLKILQPNLVEQHNQLSAELCADRLLPLEVEEQQNREEAARLRAENRLREQKAAEEEAAAWQAREAAREEEARRAEERERAFLASHDQEYRRSAPDLDWRTLHEERLAKAASRSLARQKQLQESIARLQNRHWRKKHGQKPQQSRGHSKVHLAQPMLESSFGADLCADF